MICANTSKLCCSLCRGINDKRLAQRSGQRGVSLLVTASKDLECVQSILLFRHEMYGMLRWVIPAVDDCCSVSHFATHAYGIDRVTARAFDGIQIEAEHTAILLCASRVNISLTVAAIDAGSIGSFA